MRIKAKQGWNVHIPDMNISLQNGRDFIEVNEEDFNNSIDAKRVLNLIEIDNGTSKVKKKLTPKNPIIIEQVAGTAFIVKDDDKPKQSNAIVFDPNGEADLNTVRSKQQLDAELSKPIEQLASKVEETKMEEMPKKEKVEIKAEIKETPKVEKQEVISKEAKDIKIEQLANDTIVESTKVKDNKKSKKK